MNICFHSCDVLTMTSYNSQQTMASILKTTLARDYKDTINMSCGDGRQYYRMVARFGEGPPSPAGLIKTTFHCRVEHWHRCPTFKVTHISIDKTVDGNIQQWRGGGKKGRIWFSLSLSHTNTHTLTYIYTHAHTHTHPHESIHKHAFLEIPKKSAYEHATHYL